MHVKVYSLLNWVLIMILIILWVWIIKIDLKWLNNDVWTNMVWIDCFELFRCCIIRIFLKKIIENTFVSVVGIDFFYIFAQASQFSFKRKSPTTQLGFQSWFRLSGIFFLLKWKQHWKSIIPTKFSLKWVHSRSS